ncbi:MAG TPA: Dabb family protein [Phycisphaerae bacterium]|nr:Dabb family protein [Phycisphaerae bacterium]HRR84847.1 Dabb family protein [Phycisphaerae bacterium]
MAYVHCVFFTLKPGTPQSQIDAQVVGGRELLARIPTVRRLETGRRDETMCREVSVTDFDLGLVILFDDKAGHDVYADHPLHLEYIKRHKARWARIRVFDYLSA